MLVASWQQSTFKDKIGQMRCRSMLTNESVRYIETVIVSQLLDDPYVLPRSTVPTPLHCMGMRL